MNIWVSPGAWDESDHKKTYSKSFYNILVSSAPQKSGHTAKLSFGGISIILYRKPYSKM